MNNCRRQNSTLMPLAQVAVSYFDLSGTAYFVWSMAAYPALDLRQIEVANKPDTRYRREVPLSC
jgi:hypothetical protein